MWCAWTISRARLAVALVTCVLAASASAQPGASEQSRGGEQRQDAQEPQPQARDASPPEQPKPSTQARQGEHRNRAENDPHNESDETGFLAWAGRWWAGFVGFVEANDKFLVALGALVTAAFTAILGFATAGLWWATRNLVKGAESTAAAQLRAYVFTGAVRGALPDGETGRFAVEVEVRNCGATPAHDMQVWLGVWISDHPEPGQPFQPPAADLHIAKTVMAPAATYRIAERTKEPITKWLPWLRASTNAIYAYGRVEYTDVFGNRQWTTFRLACVGEHIFGDGAFQFCLEGNDASRSAQGQAGDQATPQSSVRPA